MKKKLTKVDEKIISLFNARRENKKGKTFTRKEMVEELDALGYPKSVMMLQAMSDGVNPPIVRIERGKYIYNREPVYKDRLQLAFGTYDNLKSKYRSSEKVLTEQECIDFLNSTGKYEVYEIVKQLKRV